MSRFNWLDLVLIASSLALSLAFTPLVRILSHRVGQVARPRDDRWHKKPTPLMGGLAMVLPMLILSAIGVPLTPEMLIVLQASFFLFLVGLLDDFLRLKPYQKLIGQIIGASMVVFAGLHLHWTPSSLCNMVITIFWLVAITNAINLLDNMDGLAAGVTLIASGFLAISFFFSGLTAEPLLLAVFAASVLGFLFYNTNPASIFMGDCGSMFLGFFLASSALLDDSALRPQNFLVIVAVPVLVLLIPIFDTLLVTIVRKLMGRSVAQGGRDHLSHRLVALGMSERRAVGMLYALAAVSGLLGLLVRELDWDVALAIIIAYTVVLALLGVHLAGIKVYDESEIAAARTKPLTAFLIDLSYKRRVFEVLLDVVLIVLSFYAAHALYFGSLGQPDAMENFLRAVPVVVFVKLVTFLGMGVYRGLWRYVSVDDLTLYAKAVFLASVLSVAALVFMFRFAGFSRVVVVLDGLLLFVLVGGSRVAWRFFRNALPRSGSAKGKPILIFGAGDAGELLVRELLNNRELGFIPVGFLDDDPLKKGKVIHGLRVLGGNGAFLSLCQSKGIDEVVISSRRISEGRIEEIVRECERAGICLKRMQIQIEELSRAGFDPS